MDGVKRRETTEGKQSVGLRNRKSARTEIE